MRTFMQSRTGIVLLAGLAIRVHLVLRQKHWRDLVREFNKQYLNPFMMQHARSRLAYYVVLHHVGRRSGQPYETPVVAERTRAGFLVPLPYGQEVEWLKNVQAAGGGTIEEHGIEYRVVKPEIIALQEAKRLLRRSRWLIYQLLRVKLFMQIKELK